MAKSDELQRQTLRVLTQMGLPGKPLSARAAGEKLEIGYNQIADMAKGKTPAEKTLIKFACAVGENPSDWLRYAGKHDFAKTLEIPETAPETDMQRSGRMIAREITKVSPKLQATVLRQVLAVIRAAQDPADSEGGGQV
jgi:hypothetical protein